ncbi:alpha/beta fold hydrolase [Phenylobacterium montanum]|uniref:Alpha/beta hydrolase n=1 Tax=Phenylobacterium montanum TaxID=2823693 RepID=A0A975FXU9_9CAUL|nr:alpha/beta hydrolase [Caulobacter sp. S6]QUD86817.1 alpha/beta hydrolase [Caulobacter sp. S6]
MKGDRESARPPVIMVHGAFCGGWAFDAFREPFEAAGHPVLTPDLAGRGGGSRAAASMTDFAAGVAELVRAQAEAPILVGHSLGGLVAQLAAAKAPVRGLILLAPSAPWGVAGGSVEEAVSAVSLYALGPYWLQAIEPDYTIARTYSFDRLAKADRKAVFARMAPESGRALWETLNWWLDPFMTTMVSPRRIAAPVLGIAGGRDLVHPPATVLRTVERLGGELQVFEPMSHWLLSEPGWEEVAEACLSWIGRLERLSAA